MERTRIPVPAEVLEGLQAVRLSGRTNMFDIDQVIRLAAESGDHKTALWVYENRSGYANGILRGFAPMGGDAECADR